MASAGSKETTRSTKWTKVAPDTWGNGKYRVYIALMPHSVYWLSSSSGKRPQRFKSMEAVIERCKKNDN